MSQSWKQSLDTDDNPHHVIKGTVGAHGTILKHYEVVVQRLLQQFRPQFVKLPPPPIGAADWPFSELPEAARVLGQWPGQLARPERAARKEQQVASLLCCILPLIPEESLSSRKQCTIVDFGGGSGHLSLPLALLRPECTVICLDLNQQSLHLLRRKADACAPTISVQNDITCSRKEGASKGMAPLPTAIPNLYTIHGAADHYNGHVNVALALHLCGQATDVVLRIAGEKGASAIVAAPCCVGKLNTRRENTDVFKATGQNNPTITYPQSNQFCSLVSAQYDWNAMAKAADYSETAECRTSRNASRRTAKALLETDRRLFLEDTFGYKTILTRMQPWEAPPKNDILVAWKPCHFKRDPISSEPDLECQANIQYTVNHLSAVSTSQSRICSSDCIDWSPEEENDIKATLERFVACSDEYMVFPHNMGGRKRKIIHFVAEQMGLHHQTTGGKRKSEKVVSVRKKPSRSASCRNPPATVVVSEESVKAFADHGVVVLRNVVSPTEIALLEAGIEFNLSNPGPLAGIASSDTDPGKFFEDFCNWQRISQYRDFLFTSRLPRIASRLLRSSQIRVYHDHVLVKEPGTKQPTPWHQDLPYYNISGSQAVSFWVPIDPVPKESSLQFVSRSKLPEQMYLPRTFLSKEAKWFPEGSLPEAPVVTESTPTLSWALNPGDIVAFDMSVLHASAGSVNRRRVFSARFTGDNVRHAPREWKTSPEFPLSLKDELPANAELDHPLFPLVYEERQS